jgi:hypothetical protein
VLRLLDLEHAKTVVLNSLTSPDAQRGYRQNHGRSFDRRDGWVKPIDYEGAVVVDAVGQRKPNKTLAGVNGEVCTEKRKKLWKERKKDLTRTCIVRDGRERR